MAREAMPLKTSQRFSAISDSFAQRGSRPYLFGNNLRLSGPISRDIAILSLRYPISRDTCLREVSTPPKRCDTLPPLPLGFTLVHLCNTPFCNISRDICAVPHKTSTTNCDTIAASIARYEKYRSGPLSR